MSAPEGIAAVENRATRIYSATEVEAALSRMAEEMSAEISGTDPILLCVMNGGLIVTGRLAAKLRFPLRIDYLQVSRYRGATRSGGIDCRVMPALDLTGRVVLVVDDILDQGHTLDAVLQCCRERGASRVLSAVLAVKRLPRREVDIAADFHALSVPDRYVYGCGMDYQGYLRNVDGVYAIADEDM